MSIIRWENPPRGFSDEVDDIVNILRAEPDKWALVREGLTGDEANMWGDALAPLRSIEYRFSPTVGESWSLYARWTA